MTKENLIQDLKEYKTNTAKLKLRRREKKKLERRLKQYKTVETSTTRILELNCDIHSKNKINNKVEKAAIETIEINEKEIKEAEKEIKELEIEIEDLEDKVVETSIRLSSLKYKEKEILYAYYIEGRTYEDIGNNLYFRLFNQTRNKDSIKDIVENATKKMLNL